MAASKLLVRIGSLLLLAGATFLTLPAQAEEPVKGKPAPEIQGEDIDGKKFKLSDYRGKVVLLDFWGDW